MRNLLLIAACVLAPAGLAPADDPGRKYPLDPSLKVLAEDVVSAKYRALVLEKMLSTDLAAEWQRVATADNADTFLAKHGGKEKVLADPELKGAYERRLRIREDFLALMREGFKRRKQVAPFDRGEKAEPAGTLLRQASGPGATVNIVLPSPGAERNWPRFRGPSGQGWSGPGSLPTRWDKQGTNIIWRTTMPGVGNSSPIVWGDHIFLTTSNPKGTERFVHCIQRADGKIAWTKQAPAHPPEGVVNKNGYASATSVTDGKRVISFLGSCGLVCHDFDGNQLWHFDDLEIKTTHGSGSSPVLYKDLVILVQDQNQADSIFLALDKRTGKKAWRQQRPKAMTWCTPIVARAGDRDELIFAGGGTLRGYEPLTGKELWVLNGPTVEVVPTVVVGRDLVYSASGRNGPTLGVRLGGLGNVTEKGLAWRAVRGGPHVPSPILENGRLYTANDTGIVTCLDATTGQLLFQERIHDQFTASPVSGGGHLYFPGESGVTYVLKASDRFEVVARNDLGAPILASPAVMDGRIYLRTQGELICIGDNTR